MNFLNKYHPLAQLGIIIGASFLIAALFGVITVFRIRAVSDSVSVTGSAKMQVTSDQAKWTSNISRSVRESTLREGYSQIARDLTLTKTFLTGQGITAEEMIISPVSMMEIYQQNQGVEKLYTLSQTITVQSPDVAKITTSANNAAQIINQGVLFSTLSVEYFYSKLPEARISLLSLAIDDAKARAAELAKNSGRRVGSLRSASSGVVQVQSLNSTDISDYGMYDTSQIEKQITVTVKTNFSLR